ncbi:CLUMA_CG017729, isoform A [Clunio marinus]|uniref:CLUMA_CG017729, isoform A n=1 Tax=Clunio marinus TaxID=568069 RepID=A0A1J1J1D4_9DIPT|nr:CLUMA_CG017729, isoform A [Clunio marinus]
MIFTSKGKTNKSKTQRQLLVVRIVEFMQKLSAKKSSERLNKQSNEKQQQKMFVEKMAKTFFACLQSQQFMCLEWWLKKCFRIITYACSHTCLFVFNVQSSSFLSRRVEISAFVAFVPFRRMENGEYIEASDINLIPTTHAKV